MIDIMCLFFWGDVGWWGIEIVFLGLALFKKNVSTEIHTVSR